MKTHILIEIEGNDHYFCRVDSSGLIITVDPHNDYLHLRSLREVYDEFYDKAKFTLYDSGIEPDLLVGEDIYKRFLEKNPELQRLTEIFDMEIVS